MTQITASKTDNFSCAYLIILVMAENGDCPGGGCSDDSVWIQKLQINGIIKSTGVALCEAYGP